MAEAPQSNFEQLKNRIKTEWYYYRFKVWIEIEYLKMNFQQLKNRFKDSFFI